MAGEIASAYLAIYPSMRNFGPELASQVRPVAVAQGRAAGAAMGSAMGTAAAASASQATNGWLSQTAAMAVKNVALYGSMYAVIQGVRSGVRSMFDDMVGFNAELEQSDIGFTTMLKSASAARQELEWIKDFAKETPFNYGQLVGLDQQLIAYGFNVTQAHELIEAAGDAAAALGRGTDGINRINLALGQMWTKGKVQSQEMLQLTEAGIGAWQILAEAYGASVADVQDAVTKGLVSAEEAVPALIAGIQARYGGLMEAQSKTFTGIVSNIQDTLQQEFAAAGEPLFQELKSQAEDFLDALDEPEVLELMRQVGSTLADGVRILSDAGRLAWEFRDGIFAVGVAIVASKLLAKVPTFSLLSAKTWYDASVAQAAYSAGLSRTSAATAGLRDSEGKLLLAGQALRGAAQIGGLAAMVDGYGRAAKASEDAGQGAIGFAEAVGGGALAGAAFGGAVGAAAGAVVGLVGSIWSMSAAMQAANADTSAAKEALQDLGIEARLTDLILNGLNNDQIAAAGGIDAMREAIKSGTWKDYVAGLEEQSAALREQIRLLDEQQNALEKAASESGMTDNLTAGIGEAGKKYSELSSAMGELESRAYLLDAALAAIGANSEYFAAGSEQAALTSYQQALAMDMQAGAIGRATEAAWQAVVANGGLSDSAITAQLRAEALAGAAGYLTQAITGIPVNTAINFSSNANEVLTQIIQLQAAAAAGFSSLGMTPDGYERRLRSLQAKFAEALSSSSVSLSLPSGSGGGGGGGGGGGSIVDEAARAAEAAARQLEQDRNAQLRFGDAFGSVMEAALEGNFDQFRERLQSQIVSLARDGYQAAADQLKRNSATLTQAALDYASLIAKLDKATDAYDDLTSAMRDQYAASRDQILGLGQLTDAQSYDQLAYLLGETTSRTAAYQDALQALKEQGLSEDLWNQLAKSGPESMGLAQSILAQGQVGIESLNALSDNLVGAADSMGDLVAESMFGQGKAAMEAYIDGLESGEFAVRNKLATIGNNVLNQAAGAITPGNAGYAAISAEPKQVINQFRDIVLDMSKIPNLRDVQDIIDAINQAATTQLVNAAGQVIS